MLFIGSKEKNKENDFNLEVNLAISNQLEKFGFANAEHFKSYSDLQKIANSKINTQYAENNYHQQSGFSAEIKTEARRNAKNIMDGKNIRVKRTDNIGQVNHPKFDHVEVDKKGNPILTNDGSFQGGSQQKVHINLETYDRYSKIEWYEKYKDTPIDVPSDQLDEIKKRYSSRINELKQQELRLRKEGKIELADQKKTELERTKDVKNRFRDSNVSTAESMEARKSPTLSVVKDVAKISHKAGLESAKSGAVIGGTISFLKNIFSVKNREKDVQKAMKDVAFDTGKSTLINYATAASSTTIQGVLKASSNQIAQNLAKGSMPTVIFQTGIILSKQTKKLITGEITISEFTKNIGQEGMTLATSLTGANLGAIVGTFIVPGVGSIVGGVIGGMVTSIMSSSIYSELQKSIHDTELSNKQREMIRDYCAELIKQEREYREYTMAIYDQYFNDKEVEIRRGFEKVNLAIQKGDNIHDGLSMIGQAFNLKLKFETTSDFEKFIKNEQVLRL